MTIIDGVGNEVTQFFFIVICGLIALLAWWSTGQRQNRFRTAVILERNVRNVYRVIPQNTNGQNQTMLIIQRYSPENNVPLQPESADTSGVSYIDHDSPMLTGSSSDDLFSHSIDSEVTEEIIEEESEGEKENTNISNENIAQEPSSTQSIEMNNIVDAMDSDASVLRNRRLEFFANKSEQQTNSKTIIDTSSSEAEAAEQTESKMNTSTEQQTTFTVLEPNTKDAELENNSDENNIRIRLKYLNDDIKSVDGKLKEPLGEFKRRHFKVELSARKLVRLIFNGQVLKPEAATLESCGLFDNCVVHCLVHQPKTPQQMAQMQQQLNPTPPVSNFNNNGDPEDPQNLSSSQMDFESQDERDWDLSHLLFTLLASLLSVVWYIHIRFSSFFGVAASMAVLGLTVIYIVAVICVYFPEFPSSHTFRTIRVNPDEVPEAAAPAN